VSKALFPPLPPLAPSTAREDQEDSAWLQDSAFDVLEAKARRGTFASAWATYYALVITASEFHAEVAPDHDGLPFQTTLARLAMHSNQPPPVVSRRLAEFVRYGLLDAFTAPADNLTACTLRLRTVAPAVESSDGKETTT
jgi:hypothetical protein